MSEPKCRHKRKGIVTTGKYVTGEPHAATNCCDRPACIDDAIRWVNQTAMTRTGHFVRDAAK